VDLERWLRLDRAVFKTTKVDVLMLGLDLSLMRTLAETARALDIRLSIRTDCTTAPPRGDALRSLALLDVLLCPAGADSDVAGWLAACREAGLRARVQIMGSLLTEAPPAWVKDSLTPDLVSSVNLAAWDPFVDTPRGDASNTQSGLDKMNAIASELAGRGLEVNLLGTPFCHLQDENLVYAANSRQFHLDHQHYHREAYGLARKLHGVHPVRARQILLMLLGMHTSTDNPIDRILMPWIWQTPWVRARAWAAHKVLRHFGWRKWETKDSETESSTEAANPHMASVCSACRLRRICDGMTTAFCEAYPGLSPKPQSGEVVLDPFHFSARQPKHYDAVDLARLTQDARWAVLAEQANAIIRNRPPDTDIDSFSYQLEGSWSFAAPGSLRWYSFSRGEKTSTPLARLEPPFTLAVTVGGGIAEYVGFALGKACRIMCPMTSYTHRLVLHVEGDGQYVFLRDGSPVRPVEFSGNLYVPTLLGAAMEPRICARNIDGTIATQAVQIWQGATEQSISSTPKVFSIVTVCTRYARRLQACLQSIAHQRGIDLSTVEILVSHVPGLDATGDVIDSIRATCPELTLTPLTFGEELANAKGLMLNEAFDKARGEWVMVLDADVVLPPTLLARLADLPADCMFAVPDGRKMLDRDTTSRVLLGEIAPWDAWDSLVSGPGEYRRKEVDGVPIGYCQCVRRACLEKVRYEEANHFEGADWRFGKDMRDVFGEETRLSGMPVLHLDHGSSNWYGALRHF
jgi:hypothetical protein